MLKRFELTDVLPGESPAFLYHGIHNEQRHEQTDNTGDLKNSMTGLRALFGRTFYTDPERFYKTLGRIDIFSIVPLVIFKKNSGHGIFIESVPQFQHTECVFSDHPGPDKSR